MEARFVFNAGADTIAGLIASNFAHMGYLVDQKAILRELQAMELDLYRARTREEAIAMMIDLVRKHSCPPGFSNAGRHWGEFGI